MIKSIVKHANGTSSIELSSKDDIESLDVDSYGIGSTARVTGQITEEYVLTAEGWKMTDQYTPDIFTVILDPENEDLSGSMDSTVAEITEALQAGRTVMARIGMGPYTAYIYLADAVYHEDYQYPSYSFVFNNTINNTMVYAYTGFTDDGDKTSYSVIPYALTPANG